MTRDVQLAEDLAQDALVAALEQWPDTGVPTKPAAWLMTTAKRRGIDHFRRAENLRGKTEELGHAHSGEEEQVPDLDAQVDYIEDDVLRLIFLSCHPALSPDSRAALTLRLVGGLTTSEIARGFLVAESAMGQRISRAKKTLSEARASFDLPTGRDREERLDDVMAVIYLIFNEGYSAAAGDDWMRPDLAQEGIRLSRMLAVLAPDEPEVLVRSENELKLDVIAGWRELEREQRCVVRLAPGNRLQPRVARLKEIEAEVDRPWRRGQTARKPGAHDDATGQERQKADASRKEPSRKVGADVTRAARRDGDVRDRAEQRVDHGIGSRGSGQGRDEDRVGEGRR